MNEHRLEVADVFRIHEDDFLAQWGHVLSREQRKAFADIRDCRTGACGGRMEQFDCGHRVPVYNSCVMGSNSLWGVEGRLSGRSKLFSLIQAVLDGCRLPITNRPFCGWDMQIAMRGSVSMLVVISRTAGITYIPITQGRASWATLTPSRARSIAGTQS